MKRIFTFLILVFSLIVCQAQHKSHTLSLHFGELFFMPPQWNSVIVNRVGYSFLLHRFKFQVSAYALGGGGINAIRSYSLFKTGDYRSIEEIEGHRYARTYLGGDVRVGYKVNRSIKHSLFLEGVVSQRNGEEREIVYINPWPPYDAEGMRYNVKQWGIGLGLSHRWHFTPSQRFFMTEDIMVQKVFKSEANVSIELGLGVRLNK